MILKHNKGVTLIELLIVMVIAAVLVAGIYALFATQQRSYFVQDRVAGIQQDARAALAIMAKDIRMAGFLTDAGSSSGFDGISVNTHNFAVEPINNGGPNGTDQITLVFAAEEATAVTNVAGTQVDLAAGGGSQFNDTTRSYVAFEGEKQLYQIEISGVDVDNDQLTLTVDPPAYLADPDVQAKAFVVKAITYSVTAPDGSPGVGVLRRDENTGAGAQPLAGDGTTTVVEDLQFAYQVTGMEGSDNWIYDENIATWPAGKSNADIRMVRINIIVRTAVPDPEETSFFKPACEDNPQNDTDTGCRRRVYTTVVKARNL